MSFSEYQPHTGSASRAVAVNIESGVVFVPVTPDVAAEFNKNPRTIKRWINDPVLGFPTPVRINGRLYIARDALEEWKRARVAASLRVCPRTLCAIA
jgi:hypothetical protein